MVNVCWCRLFLPASCPCLLSPGATSSWLCPCVWEVPHCHPGRRLCPCPRHTACWTLTGAKLVLTMISSEPDWFWAWPVLSLIGAEPDFVQPLRYCSALTLFDCYSSSFLSDTFPGAKFALSSSSASLPGVKVVQWKLYSEHCTLMF